MRHHRNGAKRLHHPLASDLALDFEALELPGDEGQRIKVYSTPPDTPSAQALALLAGWTFPHQLGGRHAAGLDASEKTDD